jgi:hypothetical protein
MLHVTQRLDGSIADLPIRQTYYFGTEGEQKGANPKNQNSLLMASYSDRNSIPFWKGLENSDVFQGYRPRYLDRGENEPLVPAEGRLAAAGDQAGDGTYRSPSDTGDDRYLMA